MSQMKSVVCAAPGELRLGQVPIPTAGEGDVLLRVRRIGVCGTDMHIFRGTQPFLQYPRVMGHELSGEIVTAPAGSGRRRDDLAGQLVPHHARILEERLGAAEDMHVRTAHADAPHAQQHVALTGRGDRYLPKTEFAGGCAYDTFHLTHC